MNAWQTGQTERIRQKIEDRRRKTEDRRQETEDRRQNGTATRPAAAEPSLSDMIKEALP